MVFILRDNMDTIASWNDATSDDKQRVYRWLASVIDNYTSRPDHMGLQLVRESDIRSVGYVYDTQYTPPVYTHFVTFPHRSREISIKAPLPRCSGTPSLPISYASRDGPPPCSLLPRAVK